MSVTFQLTPSRRATLMKSLSRLDVVFQLTPSRRATWIYRTIGEFFSFQLTPSRRATHRISMILSRQDISTHALTEGDSGREPMTTPAAYFNSRPHGGRQSIRRLRLRPRYFNSRPHGGRLLRFHHPASFPYFNSRPHGGRQR